MRPGFDIHSWIAEVAKRKPEMDELAFSLREEEYGARVAPNKEDEDGAALHYWVAFLFPDAVMVTIGIILMDHQTNFDVVIETITTLPPGRKREGFGSKAVAKLLEWAVKRGLSVAATQVSGKENEGFWTKNGFVRLPEPNPTCDFVWQGRLN